MSNGTAINTRMVPDLDALQAVLAGLSLAPATAITPLAGGSSAVWRIDLADGSAVVLKAFAAEHVSPNRDAYAASLLAGIDVPVTRYLVIDDTRTRLRFRFALTTHIDGAPATAFASHPDFMDVFRQMGAVARTLHGVVLPGFGPFSATGAPPHRTNATFVRSLAADAFKRFLHYGGDPVLAARLEQVVDRDFDAIVPASRAAVFAHNDLHPGNILVVERDGALAISGLIDFGNARASSSVMDLAKAIFNSEHMAPGCGPFILAGYGAIDHPRPAAALAFYTLLHRVSMWAWLRQIGALPAPDAANDIIPALLATAERA